MSSDPDRLADLENSWIRNAEPWTQAVRSGAIASRRLATDDAILRAIFQISARNVLDLGCGEGWLCRSLHAHGITAVGVDGSEPLIRAARQSGQGIFHVLGYDEIVENPDRAGSHYDAIVANFSLLQRDLAPLLAGVATCLAASGRLLIQTVHPASITPYIDGWREEDFAPLRDIAYFAPMPWYFRTLRSWLGLLTEAGYALAGIDEPVHPETGVPLSIILIAAPA